MEITDHTWRFGDRVQIPVKPKRWEIEVALANAQLNTNMSILQRVGFKEYEALYRFHVHPPTHKGNRYVTVEAYVNFEEK